MITPLATTISNDWKQPLPEFPIIGSLAQTFS